LTTSTSTHVNKGLEGFYSVCIMVVQGLIELMEEYSCTLS